jgi:hypothetical protein
MSEALSCPSARPDMAGARVLGVVQRTGEGPRVAYAAGQVPVTEEVLAATGPVPPMQVYRFAAPCQARKCQHFDGATCQLATRIVLGLEAATAHLPACAIRRDCRWYHQEGAAACHRCPQVVTEITAADDPVRAVAEPV